MTRTFYLFLILSLSIFGCSEFSSEQQALLDKKWYCGKGCSIEFNSDMTLTMKFDSYKFQHKFKFKSDNSFQIISDEKKVDDESASFYIKDSVLLLVSDKSSNKDSAFHHLNEKYEKWQIKQIFIYGKVMTKQEPLPYIKFEF